MKKLCLVHSLFIRFTPSCIIKVYGILLICLSSTNMMLGVEIVRPSSNLSGGWILFFLFRWVYQHWYMSISTTTLVMMWRNTNHSLEAVWECRTHYTRTLYNCNNMLWSSNIIVLREASLIQNFVSTLNSTANINSNSQP